MTVLKHSRLKAPLVVAMVGLGLLALSPLMRTRWQSATDCYWAAQIEQLPDDEAEKLVHQWAQRDEYLRLLARILCSRRPSVSAAAQLALLAEIDSWRIGRPDAKERAALLAAALRGLAVDVDGEAAGRVYGVAISIAEWAQGSKESNLSTVEDCQHVLAIASPAVVDGHQQFFRGVGGMDSTGDVSPAELPPQRAVGELPELAQLPGARAMLEAEPKASTDSDSQNLANHGQPELGEPGPFEPPRETQLLTSGVAGALHMGQTEDESRGDGTISGDHVIRLASDIDNGDGVDPLVEVLYRHHRSGRSQAEHSSLRDELSEFDLNEVELALFGELLNPVAARRRELAETLPGLRSIDSRRWLKLLAYDDDAGVRLTALTLLATTGDPALLTFAKMRAARDVDDRVRNQLGKQLNVEHSR